MKIGNNPEKLGPNSAERVASTKLGGAVKGGKAQPAETSIQVELSATVSGLQGGVTAEGEGDFDAQKVDRIAQSIASGQFKINAEVIADKLIANAKDVLGKGSR
jgi:negative regulator of flagellin synthesis FlgM